jgi:hypothetical protein
MGQPVALALAVLVIFSAIRAWLSSSGSAFEKVQDKVKTTDFSVPLPDSIFSEFTQ